MLLQELFHSINLSEARRNPGQNEKLAGHPAAVKFLEGLDHSVNHYGVSMTMIPKLGINPGSKFNTPVGVYFYPAEYYLERKAGSGGKNKLDYQDDAPYIQIFEIYGSIEYIDEIDSSAFNKYVGMLFKNIGKVAQLIGKSENNAEKHLANAIASSLTQAKKTDNYGGRLWYVLYSLSRDEGAQKRDNAAPRSAVIWNSLLRLIDIETAIDNGSGIIHENEPTQGVVLNPRNIKLVRTIENKTVKDDPMSNDFMNLANMKVDDNYIKNVVQYVRELGLAYNPLYRKYSDKIIRNVMKQLQDWPGIYKRLDISDINFILELNKSAEVAKELTVGLYAAKFPKVRYELDSMMQELADYIADPAEKWAEKQEVRKKRAHAIIIDSLRTDHAKKMIRDLTPYKSDPRAAEMITYLNDVLEKSKIEHYL